MKTIKNASSSNCEEVRKPIVLIKVGRGRLGGSTLLQVLSERAIHAGRSIIMGDADRNNTGLSASPLYEKYGLKRPNAPDKVTMEEWLDSAFGKAIEEQKSLLLDVGGGDQLIKDYSTTMSLIDAGKELGITIVGLFMCGTANGDFDFIKKIWEDVGFHPEKSILVFNEFTVPDGIPPNKMYNKVITHDRCEFFEQRTKLSTISMPKLRYMNDVLASGLSFQQVMEGMEGKNGHKFNPMARFCIKKFFEDIEKSIQLSGAEKFLP